MKVALIDVNSLFFSAKRLSKKVDFKKLRHLIETEAKGPVSLIAFTLGSTNQTGFLQAVRCNGYKVIVGDADESDRSSDSQYKRSRPEETQSRTRSQDTASLQRSLEISAKSSLVFSRLSAVAGMHAAKFSDIMIFSNSPNIKGLLSVLDGLPILTSVYTIGRLYGIKMTNWEFASPIDIANRDIYLDGFTYSNDEEDDDESSDVLEDMDCVDDEVPAARVSGIRFGSGL